MAEHEPILMERRKHGYTNVRGIRTVAQWAITETLHHSVQLFGQLRYPALGLPVLAPASAPHHPPCAWRHGVYRVE